jgi:hypothetical protein
MDVPGRVMQTPKSFKWEENQSSRTTFLEIQTSVSPLTYEPANLNTQPGGAEPPDNLTPPIAEALSEK